MDGRWQLSAIPLVEPWMFGTIPAKGFYIRHARGISLSDVHFHYAKPDGRPLFVTDDAGEVYYHNITVDGQAVEVAQ